MYALPFPSALMPLLLLGACAAPSTPPMMPATLESPPYEATYLAPITAAEPYEATYGMPITAAEAHEATYLAPITASDAQRSSRYGPPNTTPPKPKRPVWHARQSILQGYIGVGFVNDLTITGGDDDVEGDFSTYPTIGGGAQWKLGGSRVDWGVETLLAFGGRANAVAFSSGGGGGTLAVSLDMLLLDVYGGPFASIFLGDEWRVYGAAGPLVQWVSYDQSGDVSGSGTGFGVGWYARTGIEYLLNPGMMMGIGARWSDSRVDLGSELGDLELDGTQVFLTVTKGF